MRQRVAIAVAVLAAAGIVIAATRILPDDKGSTGSTGPTLAWDEPPLAFTPERLPDDRVAYGTVRNPSPEQFRASTGDFEVRDAKGDPLDASVQFLGSFAHGLYGAFQKPDPLPPDERTRLGLQVDLEPGETTPLTVSYHLGPGAELPAALYYGDEPVLELPESGDPTG